MRGLTAEEYDYLTDLDSPRIVEFADNAEAELDKAYAECNVLPREPDRERLDRLCIEIVESHIFESLALTPVRPLPEDKE